MDYHKDVQEWHRDYDLPYAVLGKSPHGITDDDFLYRFQHLIEELNELLAAHRAKNLPRVADALADLIWVAIGTAQFYGIHLDGVWREIRAANRRKVRAFGEQDPRSKRVSAWDVVKPDGWIPPDIEKTLEEQGWNGRWMDNKLTSTKL